MTGWVVETLVATTLLMGVVLLIRGPMSRAFGARAAFALWFAPLLRAILPPVPVPVPVAAPMPEVWIEVGTMAATAAQVVPPAPIPLNYLLLALWIGGAVSFLAWQVIAYHFFLARALRGAKRLAQPASYGAMVLVSPYVTGPAATGLLVRRIFVPMSFEHHLTPEEQRLALAHEALHHRRGDLWASAAAVILLAMHWFNPIAYLAHRAFRRDLEAACDATLLRQCGAAVRERYARTILRCVAQPMPQPSCALTHIDELKGRLDMLNLDHGRIRRLTGNSLAAAFAGGSLLLGLPALAEEAPSARETLRTGLPAVEATFSVAEKAVKQAVRAEPLGARIRVARPEAAPALQGDKIRVVSLAAPSEPRASTIRVVSFGSPNVPAPEKPTEERVEIRNIVRDGKEIDGTRRGEPGELRAKMADCTGEKFEAETPVTIVDGKGKRSRIIICSKPGSSQAETAASLEKVLSRIEGTSDMPAENKAQIIAKLKARIAELKSGS